MGPSFADTSPPDIGLVWVKRWSHITEGTLCHVVLVLFLRNRFKSILSMYRPTRGYRSRRISNRPANLANSTLLSRTSGPCSRGSIELVVFNTESYGRQPVLENLRAGKRQKQLFVIVRVDHCQSPPLCTIASHSLWATIFSTKTNLKDPERLIIRL